MTRIQFCKQIANAVLTDPVYPGCKINGKSLYDERVMSMPSVISSDSFDSSDFSDSVEPVGSTLQRKEGHFFFFVFNFENYYHFLYDTLPYLHFFWELRKQHPFCKLLISKAFATAPLAFQTETFQLLGLSPSDDCVVAEEGCLYEWLYVPSSLTHGTHEDGSSASMDPPSVEAYPIWQSLGSQRATPWNAPKKFYISRRSWIHGKLDNIGTNYTTRRRCINEDDVVDMLSAYGFEEVFCELLSMSEKIYMFQNATHVVGCIGGGMANLLFSPPSTQVACLPTPDFLRINSRFQHSMNHTQIQMVDCMRLAEHEGPYPLYTRVQHKDTNKIGEVCGYSYSVETNTCSVQWSEAVVAGFSLQGEYSVTQESPTVLTALDQGLNSPFVCDLQCLRQWCEEYAKNTTIS